MYATATRMMVQMKKIGEVNSKIANANARLAIDMATMRRGAHFCRLDKPNSVAAYVMETTDRMAVPMARPADDPKVFAIGPPSIDA